MISTQNGKPNNNVNSGLAIGIFLGIAFRVYHLFIVGFKVPFNLGGLFYQMSLEIIKNGFLLPASIPYYYPGGLPFAYPPLPFYIQAIILKLASPELFITTNILPPFFSILSLFAFIFLSRKLIKNNVGVAAAVFAFSIIPIAYREQIEAMGLAESLGTGFFILYLLSLEWAREKEQSLVWPIPGIFLGLCVMSSPGSLYASIIISILFFGFSLVNFLTRKEPKLLMGCLCIGAAGLLFSSPYWYPVITRHGIQIFTNAFSAQNAGLFKDLLQRALHLKIINTSPFWNILFLFGLVSAWFKKQYSVILLSIVLMIIPREYWLMSIPASLLIGIGFVYFLEWIHQLPKITGRITVGIIGVVVIFSIIDSGLSLLSLIKYDAYDISEVQIKDLRKVNKSNLIPQDQYVIVVGNKGLIEWSPSLMQSIVINNPYGLEWLPDRNVIIQSLTEILLQTHDPDGIFKTVQEYFNDNTSFYLIANQEYLHKIDKSNDKNMTEFEILQEYDELGLGLITIQN